MKNYVVINDHLVVLDQFTNFRHAKAHAEAKSRPDQTCYVLKLIGYAKSKTEYTVICDPNSVSIDLRS